MCPEILVADDEPDMLELLSYNLKLRGYHVVTASSGEEALQKIHTLHPDLAILDVMMAHTDGLTLCETLRNNAATATLPVILLTALSGQIPRVAGLAAGADAYLTKPFDPNVLVGWVERLLQRGLNSGAVR